MIFKGWVAVPRSILHNTHTGKLSNNEQLVLITLILLADAKTGSGHINAAAIRTYLPELEYETAKRILKSLQDKRFLYRQIRHSSKALYPYWIHGYQISDGPHKMSWTNLSQVFVTRDINLTRYDKSAPEDTPEHTPEVAPEVAPEHAPNNNKDPDNDTHKDTDQPCSPMSCDLDVIECDANESHEVTSGDAHVTSVTKGDEDVTLPSGFELRDGRVFTTSGVEVAQNIVPMILKQGGKAA